MKRKLFVVIVVALLVAGLFIAAGNGGGRSQRHGEGSSQGRFVPDAVNALTGMLEKMRLAFMKNDDDVLDTILRSYVSPAWIKANNINLDSYKMNNYLIVEYAIDKVTPPIITAFIINRENKWAHRLYFKMSFEGGKWYCVPTVSADYPEWIDIWQKVDEYIKFDFGK